MNNINTVYLGDYKALFRTVWGQIMVVDTRDVLMAPYLLLDGFWEAWVTNVFRKVVREGMTVVDIGANIGYYTLMAAALVGNGGMVYSFEPNPTLFPSLTRNVHMNWFFHNVALIQKAAFEKRCKIDFFMRRDYPGNSSIGAVSQDHLDHLLDGQTKVEVEAISLDDYFVDSSRPIDVIKIDVEGAEPFVFRGMKNLLLRNPSITILSEWSPSQMRTAGADPEHFLKELLDFGFPLLKIEEDLVSITPGELLETDPCYLFLKRA